MQPMRLQLYVSPENVTGISEFSFFRLLLIFMGNIGGNGWKSVFGAELEEPLVLWEKDFKLLRISKILPLDELEV